MGDTSIGSFFGRFHSIWLGKNGWKARPMATRFFPSSPTCICTAFRPVFSATLSRPGLDKENTRTHPTILVHARTLHYKFDCVWKLPRPLLHQIIDHDQRTLTTWQPFILTKNLNVLGTASVRISKGNDYFIGSGTAFMGISMSHILG